MITALSGENRQATRCWKNLNEVRWLKQQGNIKDQVQIQKAQSV